MSQYVEAASVQTVFTLLQRSMGTALSMAASAAHPDQPPRSRAAGTVAVLCVVVAVVLGDHHQRVIGGVLMGIALVATMVALVLTGGSER